ncbi:RhuM family protein [Parapedobacter deserti]
MNLMTENQIEIYQSKDGQTLVEVRFEQDTIWLTQAQIAKLFETTPQNITMHLRSIYNEYELEEIATCKDFLQVRKEGNRTIKRNQKHYNLDAIISIGYRVKSIQATQFRIWATQRLREYLVQGYAINERRLAQKQQEVQTLKDGIRILSRAIEKQPTDGQLDWLTRFAKGLELLDDYDHEQLDEKGVTKKPASYPTLEEYQELINTMKTDFASEIFGKEKDKGFQSAIAQISKGFADEDFYPSLEEKAATLLYLVIKNHAFVDGNKRIAAACFLLFLERNNLLYDAANTPIISNEALATLTLFVAASKPEEMETVKKLTISVLNRRS